MMEKRDHMCSICHKVGPWSGDWCWYGSYRQLDDGEEVVKLCSPACRAEYSRRRKQASLARARARQIAARLMHGGAR